MLQNSKQDIADVFRGKIERRLVWLMSLVIKNQKWKRKLLIFADEPQEAIYARLWRLMFWETKQHRESYKRQYYKLQNSKQVRADVFRVKLKKAKLN